MNRSALRITHAFALAGLGVLLLSCAGGSGGSGGGSKWKAVLRESFDTWPNSSWTATGGTISQDPSTGGFDETADPRRVDRVGRDSIAFE